MQPSQSNYLEHAPFIIITASSPGGPGRMPSEEGREHNRCPAENAGVATTRKREGVKSYELHGF